MPATAFNHHSNSNPTSTSLRGRRPTHLAAHRASDLAPTGRAPKTTSAMHAAVVIRCDSTLHSTPCNASSTAGSVSGHDGPFPPTHPELWPADIRHARVRAAKKYRPSLLQAASGVTNGTYRHTATAAADDSSAGSSSGGPLQQLYAEDGVHVVTVPLATVAHIPAGGLHVKRLVLCAHFDIDAAAAASCCDPAAYHAAPIADNHGCPKGNRCKYVHCVLPKAALAALPRTLVHVRREYSDISACPYALAADPGTAAGHRTVTVVAPADGAGPPPAAGRMSAASSCSFENPQTLPACLLLATRGTRGVGAVDSSDAAALLPLRACAHFHSAHGRCTLGPDCRFVHTVVVRRRPVPVPDVVATLPEGSIVEDALSHCNNHHHQQPHHSQPTRSPKGLVQATAAELSFSATRSCRTSRGIIDGTTSGSGRDAFPHDLLTAACSGGPSGRVSAASALAAVDMSSCFRTPTLLTPECFGAAGHGGGDASHTCSAGPPSPVESTRANAAFTPVASRASSVERSPSLYRSNTPGSGTTAVAAAARMLPPSVAPVVGDEGLGHTTAAPATIAISRPRSYRHDPYSFFRRHTPILSSVDAAC